MYLNFRSKNIGSISEIMFKVLIDSNFGFFSSSTITFSLTKNSGISQDILLMLENNYFELPTYLHKKLGQLFSKMRFLSAMLLNISKMIIDLNQIQRLILKDKNYRKYLNKFSFLSITLLVEINSIFVTITKKVADYSAQNKVLSYLWNAEHNCYRFVTTELMTSYKLFFLGKILNQYK